MDYFNAGFPNHRRTTKIARRPHNAPPTRDTGPRTNDRIRVPEIRLIGADGENVGVVTPALYLGAAALYLRVYRRRPAAPGAPDGPAPPP